jgi:hypothetical protein
MSSNNIYYVYAYLRGKDSKTAKAGTPYYIGKGKKRRAFGNHGKVPLPKNINLIKILESNLSEIGALAIERRLISWWGRKDKNTGILLNKTDGGESPVGVIISQQHRLAIKQARAKQVIPLRTDQTKRLISLTLSGRVLSDAHRLAISKSATGRKFNKDRKTSIPKGSTVGPRPCLTCPHCGKIGGDNNMSRWHFDNCKFKKLIL